MRRRQFLKSAVVAGVTPLVIPGHVLGLNGAVPRSGKINLGVLGVGAQGQSDMRGFVAQKDVRVTAICDINKRNLASARKYIAGAYGTDEVREYADFRELNADPNIDAVLMALPFHWHTVPALDAILHGKHIYHEKPMALSFKEGCLVREAVRKKKVVFQFGTQQRSDTRFRWACELALNGRLGKVKEIHVSVPGGITSPVFPEQPVPEYVDWEKWVGPAAMTSFHEEKLKRVNHENISNFSLGMISCWGIHHLDIARWGNPDTGGTTTVEGRGEYPKEGSCDALLSWKVQFEFAKAAPITFVSDPTPGFEQGIRFIGESAWVFVKRGEIRPSTEGLLADPQNQCGQMPIKLPASSHHPRNFVSAIQNHTQPICDVETGMRSDTLCQLAYIAVKRGRKLQWDTTREEFVNDDSATSMLQPRPFRGEWKLPKV